MGGKGELLRAVESAGSADENWIGFIIENLTMQVRWNLPATLSAFSDDESRTPSPVPFPLTGRAGVSINHSCGIGSGKKRAFALV